MDTMAPGPMAVVLVNVFLVALVVLLLVKLAIKVKRRREQRVGRRKH